MKNSKTDTTVVPAGGLIGRVSFDEEGAARKLESLLDVGLGHIQQSQVLIVCVGTDRSTGDAFGPIIGSRLKEMPRIPGVDVLGTLDEPVHAVNLVYTLESIKERYRTPPFIIALDACLGKFDHVGQISVENGPLRPGAGVKKSLPEFGDLTLTGIVNVSGFMEYFVLQNTRLSIVMRMCETVVNALRGSLHKHHFRQTMRMGI
ncbi:spore protease YyaC [Alicyclobacillus dauci]|uniref:Spore protease YyaC n=1 Tax=Alicyclobacillus dauci TaxID=1475485 RepID=A0ABY6Z3U3_9BACL|nr:spore protease YyaC [Alicyclobacillus dauci]WAH36996.1 spore protease YyaC [Alicyclobacillus dauci]